MKEKPHGQCDREEPECEQAAESESHSVEVFVPRGHAAWLGRDDRDGQRIEQTGLGEHKQELGVVPIDVAAVRPENPPELRMEPENVDNPKGVNPMASIGT